MDRYHNTREAILNLSESTTALLGQAESILDGSASSFERWKLSCANIQQNLVDHILRIAVVGAIKSGKSTLVNTLLQDDYLKRGAGVVTSIVTRIRRGEKLKARLFFKSWKEINADIDQALVLFPSEDRPSEEKKFDIRNPEDRAELSTALDELDVDLKIAKDHLNANSVLISSYLKGYDKVETFVEEKSTVRDFEAADFASHRSFAGDDTLAVYLKDIQLDITSNSLETNIEMADCQGSDSPNPLHMAMIQDYLLKANLIIYVISSRTGLRQADIRFLRIIKQMGIADNMLFVCNCDFNEHESQKDLERLVQKIKEELSMVAFEPQLFVFSALYHLFEAQKTKLSFRDRNRLDEWVKVMEMTSASDHQIQQLKQELDRKLTQERSALLLQNQLERLNVVHSGLLHWIRINRELLRRDANDAKSMVERIESHQRYMGQVNAMIGGTLDGNIRKFNTTLKTEIDRFFDRKTGQLLTDVVGFIRNYPVDFNRYSQQALNSGFNKTLYLVFQEFKQAVDTHMAEKINPAIIGFVGGLEERLKDFFHSVTDPFEAMVRDAVVQYEKALVQLELEKLPLKMSFSTVPDIENIKKTVGLELPSASATMQYSVHIKSHAVLRLGIFSIMRHVRKVLKRPVEEKGQDAIKALKAGILRMKRETERSVYAHFRDYQENIKFQYVLKLVNETGNHLYKGMTEQFEAHVSDLKEMMTTMGIEHRDKKQVDEALDKIEKQIRDSADRFDVLRQDIDNMRGEDKPIDPGEDKPVDPDLDSNPSAGPKIKAEAG